MSCIDWESEPDHDELLLAADLRESDPIQALSRFEALARRGSTTSMAYIGDMYLQRSRLYRSSLGRPYSHRSDMDGDWQEAERWLREGAERGSAIACYLLAWTYVNVGKPQEALHPLEVAAAQGYAPALNMLGRIYLAADTGVERDIPKARRYLERASAKGNLAGRAALFALFRKFPRSFAERMLGYMLYVVIIGHLMAVAVTEGFSSERLR